MVAHVLWEHGVAGSNPVNPTRMGISLPMDLTRAGGCPGSTTGSAGRRNQHIRDHWQEGVEERWRTQVSKPHPACKPRTFTRKPAIPLSAGGQHVTAVRRIRKNTAMRMWCSGSTPASQAGNRGFEPPSSALSGENQNNGSNPTMGLVTVLSMWTLPEKHGRTASAWARSVKE